VHYPRREFNIEKAAQAVERLSRVRRLLQAKSLYQYVGKLIRKQP
jgi:hypothetical protein